MMASVLSHLETLTGTRRGSRREGDTTNGSHRGCLTEQLASLIPVRLDRCFLSCFWDPSLMLWVHSCLLSESNDGESQVVSNLRPHISTINSAALDAGTSIALIRFGFGYGKPEVAGGMARYRCRCVAKYVPIRRACRADDLKSASNSQRRHHL